MSAQGDQHCKHCGRPTGTARQVTRVRGHVVCARHCGECGHFRGLQRPAPLAAKIALNEAERAGEPAAFSL